MKSRSETLCTPTLLGKRNISLNCNMKCEKINELSFHTSFFMKKTNKKALLWVRDVVHKVKEDSRIADDFQVMIEKLYKKYI